MALRQRRSMITPSTGEAGEDGDFVQLRLIREQAQKLSDSQSSLPEELTPSLTHKGDPVKRGATEIQEELHHQLFQAIKSNEKQKVESLLYKARKWQQVKDIRYPPTDENVLHYALSHGMTEFVQQLINKENTELLLSHHQIKQSGIHGTRNCLHIIIERSDFDMAKFVLDKVGDKQTRLTFMQLETAVEIKGQRPRLFSCLHLAAYYGNTAIVRLLLDQGMYVNHLNGKKDTALLWAARWGHNETMTLLLNRGADPEVKNDKGSTALYWAIRYQFPKTVTLLLTKGRANPNTTRKLGLVAPIIIASAYGNKNIVVELLRCPDTDVNVKIRGGDTAIHNAAREGWVHISEMLIKAGVKFDDQDDLGDTPLLLAAKYGHVNVLRG